MGEWRAGSAPTIWGHGGSFPDTEWRGWNLVLRTAAEGGLARLVKRGAMIPLFRAENSSRCCIPGPGERGWVPAGLRCTTKSAIGVHVQLLDSAAMNNSCKAICKAIPMAISMVATAVSGWPGRSVKSVAE